MAAKPSDVYYDGSDPEIAQDPYPTFRRLRDEAPLYFNDRLGFYAVSRYDDVVSVLSDNERFLSRYGGTVDMILSGMEIPPGTVLFEDDPAHAIHRSLLSRMFTPKKVATAREPDSGVLRRDPRPAGADRVRFRYGHRRRGSDEGHQFAPRDRARRPGIDSGDAHLRRYCRPQPAEELQH